MQIIGGRNAFVGRIAHLEAICLVPNALGALVRSYLLNDDDFRALRIFLTCSVLSPRLAATLFGLPALPLSPRIAVPLPVLP